MIKPMQIDSSPPRNASNWDKQSVFSVLLLLALLACMPLAVWMDLKYITVSSAQQQTNNTKSMINHVRAYYSQNIAGRVIPFDGKSEVIHNYKEVQGAIPNPATMSIELADIFKTTQTHIDYRFISDFPFQNRAQHSFDEWEKAALQSLRNNPNQEITLLEDTSGIVRYRIATPIRMDAVCVACHNSHPGSPKRDWQVGDVRGIQEFTATLPVTDNLFAFKYLIIYMLFAAGAGVWFIVCMRKKSTEQALTHQAQIEANGKLSSAIKEQEYRNWVKICESQVMTAMRGHDSVSAFAQKLISAMAPPLGGKVAAVYYFNPVSNHYDMVSSYCYKKMEGSSTSFAIGEGLVGQCVVNRSTMALTNLPPDYLQMVSGTMDISIGHIYLIPIIRNDGSIPAVIEIGTLAVLNEQQQLLLDALLPLIAMNIPAQGTSYF